MSLPGLFAPFASAVPLPALSALPSIFVSGMFVPELFTPPSTLPMPVFGSTAHPSAILMLILGLSTLPSTSIVRVPLFELSTPLSASTILVTVPELSTLLSVFVSIMFVP